ncbi:MAG TPA: hypothetical protein VM580_17175 [Labilithrix sp.]|nr:hypothetical protein [Labilithrix sp.]
MILLPMRDALERTVKSLLFPVVVLALQGCPKSEETTKPAPSASAPADAAPESAREGDAGHASTSAPSSGTAASFAGSYSVAPATLYIPATKDYEKVKQRADDPTKHVGEGTLSLSVDADGRVSGTIETGPAGPAVIDGQRLDDEIRGNVRRQDPGDNGLTGTLVGKVSGDSVEGKVSLAEANAAIVREGKFSLKKK